MGSRGSTLECSPPRFVGLAGKAAASSIEGCVGGFLRYASGMANWPRTAERIAPALAIGGVCFLFVASLIGAPKLEPGATERASPVGSGAATPKKRYSLAAIGDSLTDKKSQGGKYLEYLQEKCPKSRFDSWGKGGNMVSQMRKRFARDVLGEGAQGARPNYSHLIVLGGIADIGSNETAGRTTDKIQADLTAMYKAAHDKGITVVALTIPPWGGFSEYNDERHRMMTVMNGWLKKKPAPVDHVVDIYPKLVCNERELCPAYAWPDKLHWSKKGHEIVGELLYQQLFSDCE